MLKCIKKLKYIKTSSIFFFLQKAVFRTIFPLPFKWFLNSIQNRNICSHFNSIAAHTTFPVEWIKTKYKNIFHRVYTFVEKLCFIHFLCIEEKKYFVQFLSALLFAFSFLIWNENFIIIIRNQRKFIIIWWMCSVPPFLKFIERK